MPARWAPVDALSPCGHDRSGLGTHGGEGALDGVRRRLQSLRARLSRARALEAALAELGTSPARAALLVPGPDHGLERVVEARAGVVTVVDQELPAWRQRARLAGAGPFDLIVDAAGSGRDPVERFRRTVRHLRDGGTYLVPAAGGRGRRDHAWQALRDDLEHDSPPAGNENDPESGIRASVAGVHEGAWSLTVVRRGSSLVMLREREMTEALGTDPERGYAVLTRAGAELVSRCAVESSPEHPLGFEPAPSFVAPPLHLREYREAVCARRGLVSQRGLLTPDTFRHHQAPILKHKLLEREAAHFVREDPGLWSGPAPLPGSYFHLDNEFQGHFGHVLSEQVSRLWALGEARRAHPDLRVLVTAPHGRDLGGWQLTLLGAAGIEPGEITLLRRQPLQVERLLAATPMYSMPDYVHPDLADTWDAVGERLRERAEPGPRPRRIFVTRSEIRRPCRNQAEVEDLFARHGFEIVRPENHPLPQQVAMFQDAEVVGGFAGSGLFTLMFARAPKHVVMVSTNTYRTNNEYLISSLRGHRLSIAVSRAEVDHPAGSASAEAFKSAFTVDMACEGRWLRGVLSDL